MKVRKHILKTNRKLGVYINQLPVLDLNPRNDVHPVNAISEIVIGQMLSGAAARSIKNRAYDLMKFKRHKFLGCLTLDELRSAGLS